MLIYSLGYSVIWSPKVSMFTAYIFVSISFHSSSLLSPFAYRHCVHLTVLAWLLSV